MERQAAQALGTSNPVAGPFFDFSVPEPTGVVAVIAPQRSSLLGLVSVVAPVIVSGNTCVVVAAERAPLPAITLTEVLATLGSARRRGEHAHGLSGRDRPWLASHMDVNAIDLCGVSAEQAADLERAAAENLKRVRRPDEDHTDWFADPGLTRIATFLETKTVWHPIGV